MFALLTSVMIKYDSLGSLINLIINKFLLAEEDSSISNPYIKNYLWMISGLIYY